MTSQLQTFAHDLADASRFSNKEEWFRGLADQLMNKLCLVAGSRKYRITECEFYYCSDDHPDPHPHKEKQQLTNGELYLNKVGGLDITFGNREKKIYGGILIRGIRNLATDERGNEITKVTAELIAALGSIVPRKSCIGLEEASPKQFAQELPWEEPVQVKRFNLKPDDKNFHERPYRFIVELNKDHKFKDKTNVVRTLLASKKIEQAHVKLILDYNLKA